MNVTREEIMQLTGRELDAAVAERVMRWKRGDPKYGDMPWYPPGTGRYLGGGRMNLPKFSTDIAAAMEAVEAEVKHRPDEEFVLVRLRDGRWLAGWFDGYLDAETGIIDGHVGGGYAGHDGAMAVDDNPATAVSRAALLAMLGRKGSGGVEA